jgi:hypothetical protein
MTESSSDGTAAGKAKTYWSGFDSNEHLARFVAATLATLLPVLLLIYAGVSSLGIEFGGTKLQIGLNGTSVKNDSISEIAFVKGGLQLKTGRGSTFATTLIPANQVWVPTGVRVRPGDCIQLQASGSVDLATNQTRRINDDPSRFSPDNQYYFLVDPHGNRLDSGLSGQPRVRRRVADDLRNQLKLAPNVELGTLVATVADNTIKVKLDAKPTDNLIFSIFDTEAGYIYNGQTAGELLLSVNDLIPNRTEAARETWLLRRAADGTPVNDEHWHQNIQAAYSTTPAEVPGRIALLERLWESASTQYQRFFYEDNSGYFMASVAITKATGGECRF